MFTLNSDQAAEIANVPHFREGHYSNLDVDKTIDFFLRYYIQPLERIYEFSSETVVADIGSGYGWLAIAWAIHTPVKVVAVDMDAERLDAARRIATIIGVDDRIDWRVGKLGDLPLDDSSVDIACCIEVLEHVYGDKKAVWDLGRITRDVILFTTPNKWFPVIAHDTRLPFCHWLPVRLRVLYASLVRRDYNEIDNVFWSPSELRELLPEFKRLNGFMHFADLGSYLNVFPYYLPYGRGSTVSKIGFAKRTYFKLASLFGDASHNILPNLASIFRKV